MAWSSPVFGSPPAVPLPLDGAPAAQLFARWQWANPLAAILRFGGWTIDGAVSDRRVAAAVRQLWKVFKSSQGHAGERERRILLWEQIQWRREGLPVPCPVCGATKACPCPLGRLFHGNSPPAAAVSVHALPLLVRT